MLKTLPARLLCACAALATGQALAAPPPYLFWEIPEEAVDRDWRLGAGLCPEPLILEAGRLNRLRLANAGPATLEQPLPSALRAQLAIQAVEMAGMRLHLESIDGIALHPGGELTVEAVPTAAGRWQVDCPGGTVAVEIRAGRGARPAQALDEPIPAGILPLAKRLPAFALEAHDGRALTRESLSPGWTVLFFGYTQCPDVCPNTIARASAALGAIDAPVDGQSAPPGLLLVSVDPERDSREVLSGYVGHFGALTAARAPHERLAVLSDALGVSYRAMEGSGGYYAVAHTADLFLLAPGARLVGRFPHDIEPGQLAAAISFALRHFPDEAR